MLILKSDLEDPYVPFVTSHRSSAHVHEVRRLEHNISGPRRTIGKVLVKAGLVVAGRHTR